MDLLVNMAQGAVGAWLVLALLGWFRRKQDPLPYRWVCPKPGCDFRVKSNQPEFVIDLAERHEMEHKE